MSSYDFSKIPPIEQSNSIKEKLKKIAYSGYSSLISSSEFNKQYWFRLRTQYSSAPVLSAALNNSVRTLEKQFDFFLFNICDDVDRIGVGPGRRRTPIKESEITTQGDGSKKMIDLPMSNIPNRLTTSQKVEVLKSIYNRLTTNSVSSDIKKYRILGFDKFIPPKSTASSIQWFFEWSKSNYSKLFLSDPYNALPVQAELLNGFVKIDYEFNLTDVFPTLSSSGFTNIALENASWRKHFEIFLDTWDIFEPVSISPAGSRPASQTDGSPSTYVDGVPRIAF